MTEERETDTQEDIGSEAAPEDTSNQNTEEPSAPDSGSGGGSGGRGHRGGEGDASGSGEDSGTGDAGRPGGAGEESQATGFPDNAG